MKKNLPSPFQDEEIMGQGYIITFPCIIPSGNTRGKIPAILTTKYSFLNR